MQLVPKVFLNNSRGLFGVKRILVPTMLTDLIQSALSSVESRSYADLAACPDCGGKVRGHDLKRKLFVRIIGDTADRDIHVFVKRFYCEDCGRLCYAKSPFYPGKRLGAPVIDLCTVNADLFPYHHLARMLEAMRIRIDRGTIRNYAQKEVSNAPYVELYGLRIPVSLLSLSDGVVGGEQSGPAVRAEAFRTGGLPPAGGALLSLFGLSQKRDERYREKDKEKGKSRQKQHNRQTK